MKTVLIGLLAVTSGVALASAAAAGGPAYPANWNGGSPLPPIGYGYVYSGQVQTYQPQVVVQPVYAQREVHQDFFWMPEFHPFGPYNTYVEQQLPYASAQVTYTQPQVVYTTPQVAYSQPQAVYVQPRVTGAQPQVTYVQNQQYAVRTYSYQVLVPVAHEFSR